MTSRTKRAKTLPALLGAGVLLALPAAAQIDARFYDQQNSTTRQFSWNYVNLAHNNTGGGKAYSVWTDPHNHANVKYVTLNIGNESNPVPTCFELETNQVTGTLSSTDTRIYFPTGPTTYWSASDDIVPGSNYLSRVRLWMPQTRYSNLRIQGYDSGYNTIDFRISVTKLVGKATAEQCRNPGKPFLDYTASEYPSITDGN